MTRGKDFAGSSGGSSEPFYGIDANVSLRMGINVMAGQQAVFFGTEQALHGRTIAFVKLVWCCVFMAVFLEG